MVPNDPARSAVALAYHERTKHHLKGFAPGPETLDWDSPPAPFRRFAGAPSARLPLSAEGVSARWGDLGSSVVRTSAAFDRNSLGALLETSFAITAWKTDGADRWAVRANPSSGNLHPTEVYLVTSGVSGLADGLHHYAADEHVLEMRASGAPFSNSCAEPGVLVGLSSIHWREAWKYGERAFRYCQLDVGHAIAALRYAASALGWSARVVHQLSTAQVAEVLGLNRSADFAGVEAEDAECLLELARIDALREPYPNVSWSVGTAWSGRASRVDPHPMYHWPIIEQAARATAAEVKPQTQAVAVPCAPFHSELGPSPSAEKSATALLRQRRSAQRFDRAATQPLPSFLRILAALLRPGCVPEDVWGLAPEIQPVVFVHRVDGITPGSYALLRPGHAGPIQSHSPSGERWPKPSGCPDGIPLVRLVAGDSSAALRQVCCGQELARACTFGVAFMAELGPAVQRDPANYRRLHQEAGLLGQILYLESEAEGLRGTGIGCFFDDLDLLQLSEQGLCPIYYFVVGYPLIDPRIETEPPYSMAPPATAPIST